MAKNMTELQKIADAVESLAGITPGGGGSTGSVMIVHAIHTYEDGDTGMGNFTLDKTFQEIQDAMESTSVMIVATSDIDGHKQVYSYPCMITAYDSEYQNYYVYVGDSMFDNWNNRFTTKSTSGYPTTKVEGGIS